MELKNVIRPTYVVRNVMRSYGIDTYLIFTNRYKSCRTVKCYDNGNEQMKVDVENALTAIGVKDFQVKRVVFSRQWRPALIVRIPENEQAL